MSDTAVEEVPRAPEDTLQHEEEATSPIYEPEEGIELEEVGLGGRGARTEKRYLVYYGIW